MAPFSLLSQMLMSLRSHKDKTNKILVIVKHLYDDESVTFSYMMEVGQEVAVILPILLLLLEGRLGMNFTR